MICGLAIPYEQFSSFGVAGKAAQEIIAEGAFRKSVEAGLSVKGKPIYACLGHRREGRNNWKLGSTSDGRLRLFDRKDGVHFELYGVNLPKLFTGISVKLEAIRWRKESALVWRLLEGAVRHLAILEAPEEPAYEATFLETIQRSL